jgi:L-lactate dehydrogenase (cytochrome)
MPAITDIEDLRILAQRRVPRMFYDYVDSGSWTESTYRANTTDFERIKFRQRVAVNLENRTLKSIMAGQETAMPVALAPTQGHAVLLRRPESAVPKRERGHYEERIC